SNRSATSEQYQSEESEALGFVESMGFIMDNLNFRDRPSSEQDTLVKTLPLFQRDPGARAPPPPPAAAAKEPAKAAAPAQAPAAPLPKASLHALGKLFGAFCLALLSALGCRHIPTEREMREAQSFYDLAANAAQEKPQAALMDLERALALDPDMPEAHNAKGVLLHVAF